jgi:secreted PhoX family phosphatase
MAANEIPPADEATVDRRELFKVAGLLGLSATALGAGCTGGGTPTTTTSATTTTASTTTTAKPPVQFGALQAADANGLRLPSGFTSRIVAQTGTKVGGTAYTFPANPDGAAVFARPGGGWTLAVNHETPAPDGGVSRIVFEADGTISSAGRILQGTSRNCAGGKTPWNTWLSCEETPTGMVWECDPLGSNPGVKRPAMGAFNHEAAAVDPGRGHVYLTEDEPDGGLYRFTPTTKGNLSAGTLEVMVTSGSTVSFAAVGDPSGVSKPTRSQVSTMKKFGGGEGICWYNEAIYFTTKYDNKVWKYVPATSTLTTLYTPPSSGAVLTGVDNITINSAGDLFVAEDGGDMQVVLIRGTTVQAVAQVQGVSGSEITGPAFNPDFTRLYFSSQRSPGVTYEVKGRWA